MPILLEARKLTKHYGATVALDSADFYIYEGITGMVGPNGAGKSTAMKLFLGLLKPTAGVAEVMGQEPYDSHEARSRLGYMPEHDCLPSDINASEFLTHLAELSGIPTRDARTRAADTLRHVGLDEARYRSIGEYSTGMKQRVKLAQALVHDPIVALLDEPTAGLDPGAREDMLDLIRRIGKDFGISIVLSSHLMGDVERTCDRLIVLEGGRAVREGSVSGFTQETQSILIDVDDNRPQLIAALARRGVASSTEGGSIVVEQAGDDIYDAIRDAVVESEARLRRLAPVRHRLTDIFRDAPR